MRRCRHASASVGVRIYIFAGLRGDQLLDDLLIAENSPFQSDINTPISISERPSTPRMPKLVHLLQVRIQQILIAELPARQILIADQQALLLLAQVQVLTRSLLTNWWKPRLLVPFGKLQKQHLPFPLKKHLHQMATMCTFQKSCRMEAIQREMFAFSLELGRCR